MNRRRHFKGAVGTPMGATRPKRRKPKNSAKRLNQAQLSIARSQALAREKQEAIRSYEQMRAGRLGSGDPGRPLPSSAPTSAAE